MRKHSYQVLSMVAFVATVLAACSTDTSERGDEPDREDVLDQAVQELVAMPGGPPGAIVVVQRGAERSVHAAGVAEVGSDAAPGVDDHRRLASVAKAFSGAAVLSLVDEGVMSLDDTIGERLPNLPDAWSAVTLRQLLDHTSGLPDYSGSDAFASAVTASPAEAPPPAELLAYVEDQPLVFPPGTQYTYSNTDNITVGLMIEAVTGQDYADVLAERVFEPLELDNTSLPTGTELPEPFLHGYALDDDGQLEDQSTLVSAGYAWASGGMVSTPADLTDFIRSYVGGELFSDEARAEQQDVFIPAGASAPA
ncbi:MAG: serine hydrolase domain-containing protein, partial [Ilumatobacteraceae bacterium]